MRRIDLHQIRALPETNAERDIWQPGNLDILGQSTRTPSPSERETVLIIEHPATSFGDTLALALGYHGPAVAAFNILPS
ncbi:MAG: hypothetical protein ACKPKO_39900, partial [Candidatus Fonsibacter sp.]